MPKYRISWNIVEFPEKSRVLTDSGRKIFESNSKAWEFINALVGEYMKRNPLCRTIEGTMYNVYYQSNDSFIKIIVREEVE